MASPAEQHPLYQYVPALGGSAFFILAFFSIPIVQTFQTIARRTSYMVPLIVGGCFEIAGFIGRAISPGYLRSLGLFVFHTVLHLLAPTLYAASVYMILGQIILLTNGDALSPIPSRGLTLIFVIGDIFAFAVQSAGGGYMAFPNSFELGSKVIIVGLAIQIISFGLFITTAALFHHRLSRAPTPASLEVPWAKHMRTLYVVSGLILVRSIFRLVEFAGGYHGPIMEHEAFLFLFDSILMLGVMACLNWVHPGDIMWKGAPSQHIPLGGDDSREASTNDSFEMKVLEPRSIDDTVAVQDGAAVRATADHEVVAYYCTAGTPPRVVEL